MDKLNTTVQGLSWSVYQSFVSLPNNLSYYGLITANYNDTIYMIAGKYLDENGNSQWNEDAFWISISDTDLVQDDLFDIDTQSQRDTVGYYNWEENKRSENFPYNFYCNHQCSTVIDNTLYILAPDEIDDKLSSKNVMIEVFLMPIFDSVKEKRLY